MRILFAGTPDDAVDALEAVAAGHEVAAVLTQPDRPSGRGRKPSEPPVKTRARRLGIPVIQADDAGSPQILEAVRDLAPELLVVVAFGQILTEEFLAIPRSGGVNLHTSLLPRHRGACPEAAAILAGDSITGVTVMRVVRRMDAGPILLQRSTSIGERETAGQLRTRLFGLGAPLLAEAVGHLEEGEFVETPQDEGLATICRRIDKSDGLIDFGRSASYLARFVRAMEPWPGAFTFVPRPGSGPPLRLRVFELEAAGPDAAGEPGEVVGAKGGLEVACGGPGRALIVRVQPEGKKPMDAAAFLRGHPLAPGTRLGGELRLRMVSSGHTEEAERDL